MEKCYKDRKRAEKKYGKHVGERYIERVDAIEHVDSMEDLMRLPALRCHPLKGKYEGRHSVSIAGRYRLIFSLKGESPETVVIEEVSNHYGD